MEPSIGTARKRLSRWWLIRRPVSAAKHWDVAMKTNSSNTANRLTCSYCGHSYSTKDDVCKHCGNIFWEGSPIMTVIAVFVFMSIFFLPLLDIFTQSDFSGWEKCLWGVLLPGAILNFFFIVGPTAKGRKIRSRFKECDAIPPRHDCPDWEYEDTSSCVQIGNCRQCGQRKVKRTLHNNWTTWKFERPTSCIQVRSCLRCGEKEKREADHLWVKVGEGESGPARDWPGNKIYNIYKCQRCSKQKS
jgi:hypothetical protein